MAIPPVDTSVTGYQSGSVDRQDDIYRHRLQRPQPRPLVQHDSGYESAANVHSSSLGSLSSKSFLTFADSVKCSKLLENKSNFAPSTVVECFECDGSSMRGYSLFKNWFLVRESYVD